ncbi:hypothetical protein PN36_29555 [Candidatus Thiomargarita nelsonii]|uniref:Secreted protein n=1 Tax=Candidatus Thiomargarita nelsonii TaxID=1003181 RepID=A0A4E0RNF2_9GAMM|nr:hypothetical protein PN36_29555 [Candidatus Thiomargarita nelsonii]
MKNKMIHLSVLAMLGLFMSMNASASRMHYNMSKNTAHALAQSAWDNIGHDCTRLDEFVSIINDSVRDVLRDIGTKYRGRAAEDFGLGYIHGLRDVLKTVVKSCVGECKMLGDAMGEWSGKMFCRLAVVIGHTPTFTSRITNIDGGICGNAYRNECEKNFRGIARGMCPAYANGPSFWDFYKGAEGGSCAYNPY